MDYDLMKMRIRMENKHDEAFTGTFKAHEHNKRKREKRFQDSYH